MHNLLMTILAGICGMITTYIVVVAGFLITANASGAIDNDGGMAMGVLFMIGPFFAVLGGVISALIARRRFDRHNLQNAALRQTAPRPFHRVVLRWVMGGLATICLGIAAINFVTAGGVSDGLYAVGFAAFFALLVRFLGMHRGDTKAKL
jgi:hypothetical protein